MGTAKSLQSYKNILVAASESQQKILCPASIRSVKSVIKVILSVMRLCCISAAWPIFASYRGIPWEHHQIIIPSEAEGFDDNK